VAKAELILLALDPSSVLPLMERALNAAGHRVVVARDGKALKTLLQESTPALVMVGESFDGENGIQIAEGMLERFPTLPILMYAHKDRADMAKATLHAGLSGYLYPPLHTDEIVAAVNDSLRRGARLGDWLRREVKRTTASLAQKAKISAAERAKLEAIFTYIQDAVIVLDEELNIVFVNSSAREAFGLGGDSLAGRPVLEAIPNPDLRALLARATADPLKYHEVNFDDGRIFNAQYAPIANVGAAITMQDISYLKELDKLKNDFVHTVSHDLRSPLTAVLGYTELVERSGPLNENQQQFLQRIQNSVQQITSLINDLLDLGRLEAGFDTRRESVQLENVLKYTLDTFYAETRRKNIKLTTELGEGLPGLRANPIRIRQMLDNLVGNAIKYTPESGSVHVSILSEDRQIILCVKDSGPGVPTGEQGRIFEKFYRASNTPQGTPGSGLGLAIVKSIVDSHQGRVWIESGTGKGSSFFVVLPAQQS